MLSALADAAEKRGQDITVVKQRPSNDLISPPELVGGSQTALLDSRSMAVTPRASAIEQVIPSDGFAIALSIWLA